MRTSEAAKYARWAATAAVALTLIVAGVYGWRRWQVSEARKDAPAPVPVTVNRQSETFSFSKVDGERTLFTVRASHLTEMREGGKSLLEDVWITIYGRAGQRYDNLHATKCDYLPAEGRIVCAGEVEIDLESFEEAAERPGERTIRIRTANMSFDRESGEARTDQPVEFQFPYGTGRAVGLSYSTERAVVRLEREVEATLTTSGATESTDQPPEEPVKLTASAMEYRRGASTMRLLGPVRAHQGLRELTAGEMALKFDAAMRAERLVASGAKDAARPQLRWVEAGVSERQIEADEFVTLFAADGRATKLVAQGSVKGTARRPATARGRGKSGEREDTLLAQRVEIEFAGRHEPRALVAQGAVRLDSREGARAQHLETEALRLELTTGRGGARSGETLAPAVVELREGEEVTRLQAARLHAEFGARNRLSVLRGSGGVEIARRYPRAPEQRTESAEFAVTFGAGGDWAEAQQSGKVRFREGERSAEAERARMVRATDTLTLEGPATVADELTRTTAGKIEINQRTGEAVATGNVRTSYLRIGEGENRKDTAKTLKTQRSAGPDFAREPAHISADQLRVARVPGKATYTGRARLWQGDTVIEAERMEFDREARRLDATGKVRGVFPEAAVAARSGAAARKDDAEAQRTRRSAEKNSEVRTQDSELKGNPGDPSLRPPAADSARDDKTGQMRQQDKGNGSAQASKANGSQRVRGVVRFEAGRLAYLNAEGRAELEAGVTVETTEARMTAPGLTLEFTEESPAPGSGPRGEEATGKQPFASQSAAQGKRAVARAVATGGCTVRQGTRRGVAERCTYEASEGSFVLSGGEPTLSDPVYGTTTGRQLTFFLADDKILVETEEGLRTVTRHRVEK